MKRSSAAAWCRSPARRAGCAIWPQALGCPKVFPIPDGVGGRFSVLDPVGLLPAAVMGLDVVKLLEGAAAMNERFRTAAAGREPGAGLRRRLAPDGSPPRGDNPRAFHLGQAAGGGRPLVRSASGREPRQGRPGSDAADGRQHPRPALPRPAAPGRPPRQADHQPDRRAVRPAGVGHREIGLRPGPAQRIGRQDAARHPPCRACGHEPGLCRRPSAHGRPPPAAAGRSVARAALPDVHAGHGRRGPADRHQSLRPAGRRGV